MTMTQSEMTREQAEALAAYVHALRSDWDRPGIIAKLADAARRGVTTEALSIAAVRAACNAGNRTPAVIPLDGPHWRDHAPIRRLAGPRCPDHPGAGTRNGICGGCFADQAAAEERPPLAMPQNVQEPGPLTNAFTLLAAERKAHAA